RRRPLAVQTAYTALMRRTNDCPLRVVLVFAVGCAREPSPSPHAERSAHLTGTVVSSGEPFEFGVVTPGRSEGVDHPGRLFGPNPYHDLDQGIGIDDPK